MKSRKGQIDRVKFLFFEVCYRRFTLHQERQCWRHYPSHIQCPVVEDREQAGSVDADQPIGFCAAQCGCVEIIKGTVALKVVHAFADSALLHGGNPKPLYRLHTSAKMIDQSEDQLALASRICSADQAIHSLILHECGQHLKLLFGGREHLVLPVLRDNRQIFPIPFGITGVVCIGGGKLHQMSDTPAYQVFVALHVSVLPAFNPQDL